MRCRFLPMGRSTGKICGNCAGRRRGVRRRTVPVLVCRIAALGDLPCIWQVCARAFPAYAGTTLDEFAALCRHRWLNNPARTCDEPFGWVLETSDRRIVGFHGLVPIRLWLGDRA